MVLLLAASCIDTHAILSPSVHSWHIDSLCTVEERASRPWWSTTVDHIPTTPPIALSGFGTWDIFCGFCLPYSHTGPLISADTSHTACDVMVCSEWLQHTWQACCILSAVQLCRAVMSANTSHTVCVHHRVRPCTGPVYLRVWILILIHHLIHFSYPPALGTCRGDEVD